MDRRTLEDLCEVLEKDARRVTKQLSDSPAPTSPQDMDYVEKMTQALLNIAKTLKVKTDLDYGTPMGAMYGARGGNGGGNSGGYGGMYPMGATTGSFNGGWDSYGAQQRDSRGRYMDDEIMASVREIMDRTPDQRTKEDLRRILERR